MKPLKLNIKRTFLIGFAFFGILLLWQVYDSWCPTFLTDIIAGRMYGLTSAALKASDPGKILNVQWLVGIIMACDNLAALILLPIFGQNQHPDRKAYAVYPGRNLCFRDRVPVCTAVFP